MTFRCSKKQLMRLLSSTVFSVILLLTTFSKVFALSLSPEIGKIEETHYGWNGKTLILIQEAHVDYEGQKSLIKILESLIFQKSLRLILVEGGWDNVSLSHMRSYGDAEGRRKIAEEYLKEGKISGEEYLDIVGEHDIQLWGIEDRALYEENMKAFFKIHEAQPKQLENLSKVEAELNAQAKKIFPKEFLKLEASRKAFQDQKMALPVYLKQLRGLSPQGTVPGRYPHISQILELSGDSKNFDADKVEKEKKDLIKLLSRKVTKLEFEPVMRLREKKNLESELELLDGLFAILAANPKIQIPNTKVKNLKAYREALAQSKDVDFKLFFSELNQLEAAKANQFATTSEQKKLLETIRYAENLRKLFELKMTPEEYQAMSNLEFRNPKLEKYFSEIKNFIPIAAAFYESAIKREKALIQNTIDRMKSMPDTTGVVITGGFHSEPLIRELHKQGYTVMSVTPRFQPEDSAKAQEKYFRILKEKWSGNIQKEEQGRIRKNGEE